MSTHVVGFRPPDEQWRRMKAVWDSCVLADIPPPVDVQDFFGGMPPDDAGVEIDLEPASFGGAGVARRWQDGMREGFEITVADVPQHVTVIRFYNSW